jgi:aryl-alcohol dehydrogenase-like predicted oxidoreductase
LRDESFEIAQQLAAVADRKNATLSQFALAWVLANPIVTSAIIGPRTMQQYEDNLRALDCAINSDDEAVVDRLVPPGEHTGKGYNDPNYPVRSRAR